MAWTQRFSDTFTDTDFTALGSHTPDQGTGWTNRGANNMRVTSNRVESPGESRAFINDTLQAIQAAEIKIYATTLTVGPIIRGTHVDGSFWGYTGYWAGWSGTTITLNRVNGTGGTSLGSSTQTLVAGDLLRIEASSDQITVLLNGSAVIGPVTDATYASGTAALMGEGSVSTWGDDFKAYDDSGGGGATPRYRLRFRYN